MIHDLIVLGVGAGAGVFFVWLYIVLSWRAP